MEFENKVVVITGAAGNLGKAVAAAFGARGAWLALLDISDEGLAATRDALPSQVAAMCLKTNLLEADSVTAAVDEVMEGYGRIDVLANIAGGFTMGPLLHETADRDWDFMMGLNARSVFHMARATVPHMLAAGGGRIVSVSARAAREGKAKMGPYCASKAAVITLTETLAAEHKHAGINCNCILPGTVDTPQNRESMPGADHAKWVPPAALADVILFLASDAARCVTGAAIPVYGQS